MRKSSEKPSVEKIEREIGQQLATARREHHYSLDDLYRLTKIRPKYLRLLEAGAFNKISDGFYVRAFLKNYANHVGINGAELLAKYDQIIPDVKDPHYLQSISRDRFLERINEHEIEVKKARRHHRLVLLKILGTIFVLLLGVWFLMMRFHSVAHTGTQSVTTAHISGARYHRHIKHQRTKRIFELSEKKAKNGVYSVKTNQDLHLMYQDHPEQKSASHVHQTQGTTSQQNQLVKPTLKVTIDKKKPQKITLHHKSSTSEHVPQNAKRIVITSNQLKTIRIKLNGHLLKLNPHWLGQKIIIKISNQKK